MVGIKRVEIKDLDSARKEIERIGCDPKSVDIMAPKAVFMTLILDDIHPIDAVIIKQDMLSIGGEVAIPRDVFDRKSNCTILVMGTLKQLRELVEKLYRHHHRIRVVAQELERFLEVEYEGSEDRK